MAIKLGPAGELGDLLRHGDSRLHKTIMPGLMNSPFT